MVSRKPSMCTLISIYLWSSFVYSQCFFPDGSNTKEVEPGYRPCNSTSGGQASSCCHLPTSTCTTTGLCNGNNGYAYRGACTDPDFPNPCAQKCVDGEECPRTICTKVALMSRPLKVSRSQFSTIFPCGTGGFNVRSFCCGIQSQSGTLADCCNETITPFNFGNPFVPLSYAEANEGPASSLTTSSSSASTTIGNAPTTSSTSASPATPSPINQSSSSASPATSTPINQSSSSSSSHSAAIGAGVGVPLGVALLLDLGILFYREHKQRLKLESLLGDNLPRRKHDKVSEAGTMGGMPHELGGNYRPELNSNPIFEVEGTGCAANS